MSEAISSRGEARTDGRPRQVWVGLEPTDGPNALTEKPYKPPLGRPAVSSRGGQRTDGRELLYWKLTFKIKPPTLTLEFYG